jgi:hypothetical protein
MITPVFKYTIKLCRILQFSPYASMFEGIPDIETFPLPQKNT